MSSLRFIFQNLDSYRGRFWRILIVAFADGTASFLIPIFLSEFTKASFSISAFGKLVPYLIGCYVASLAFQWFLRMDGEALGKEFGNYLRLKYFKIIEHLDVPTIGSHHSGYLLSLVTRVCDGSSQILFMFTWLVAHSVATLSLFFIFTARESLTVAISNLVILLVFLLVSVSLSRKIVPIFSALNLKHAALIERYVDLMANILTVKKLGLFKFAETQIEDRIADNTTVIHRLQLSHANRWFVLHVIYGVAFLSTLSFMLFQIADGSSSPAALILFIGAYGVIRGQVERLSELVKDLLELNAHTAALDSIVKGSTPSTGSVKLAGWDKITFLEAEFAYPNAQMKIAIPEFCLRKGQIVSITGQSGQGKSTFLGLLSGFLDLTGGRRLLDDKSYETLSSESLTTLFSLISQDIELFNLSVRSNLCLGTSVSDQEILKMLDSLNLMDWFDQLSNGLDTTLGEKGFNVSAGQRQRLNIARGLLLDRDILLFDEATSHLDEATERVVVEFLRERLQGKTAVFVTHRPAILELCNFRYHFKDAVLQPLT